MPLKKPDLPSADKPIEKPQGAPKTPDPAPMPVAVPMPMPMPMPRQPEPGLMAPPPGPVAVQAYQMGFCCPQCYGGNAGGPCIMDMEYRWARHSRAMTTTLMAAMDMGKVVMATTGHVI